MKVFFSASPREFEKYKKKYTYINDLLEDLGYQHIDDDLIKTDYGVFKQKMQGGRDAYVDWYHKKINSINNADICIFEVSVHSLGVGFLIQRALEYSKPVIALYYKNNIPFFLSGVVDDKLITHSYNDEDYKTVIRKSLETAREKRDKRFNFFLSPKLLQYIDDAAKERGVTKSKLLRDMIVKHMREKTA